MSNSIVVFAYGSNLDTQQMRARCASARISGRAVLANHVLAFGGYSHRWGGAVASVIPERGGQVQGLMYRIIRAELADLDRHEGTPFAYERITKLVTDERGKRRRVQIYRQSAEQFEPWLPPPAYFGVILRAYLAHGFDVDALAKAAGVMS